MKKIGNKALGYQYKVETIDIVLCLVSLFGLIATLHWFGIL